MSGGETSASAPSQPGNARGAAGGGGRCEWVSQPLPLPLPFPKIPFWSHFLLLSQLFRYVWWVDNSIATARSEGDGGFRKLFYFLQWRHQIIKEETDRQTVRLIDQYTGAKERARSRRMSFYKWFVLTCKCALKRGFWKFNPLGGNKLKHRW